MNQRGRGLVLGLAGLFLIAVAAAIYVGAYADYAPHEQVREAVNVTRAAEAALGPHCVDGQAWPTDLADIDLGAALPEVVAQARFAADPSGVPRLELTLTEIRWGAPWRRDEVAIAAGRKLTFEFTCTDVGRAKAELTESGIAAEFLPRHLHRQASR